MPLGLMPAPSRATSTRATPSQRQYVRNLLREHELLAPRVSVIHRDLFQRACIEWRDGQSMDVAIDSLTQFQASRLLDQLDKEDDDE